MTDTEQDCVNAWNDFAQKHGLSLVMTVNQSRRAKLKARIKQVMLYADHFGFRDTLEGWNIALDKIEETGWMFGDNNRGWVVNFDNLIGEKFFTKLMEGGYNHATKQKTGRTNASGHTTSFGAMREIRAEYGTCVDERPRNNRVQIEGTAEKQGRLFG